MACEEVGDPLLLAVHRLIDDRDDAPVSTDLDVLDTVVVERLTPRVECVGEVDADRPLPHEADDLVGVRDALEDPLCQLGSVAIARDHRIRTVVHGITDPIRHIVTEHRLDRVEVVGVERRRERPGDRHGITSSRFHPVGDARAVHVTILTHRFDPPRRHVPARRRWPRGRGDTTAEVRDTRTGAMVRRITLLGPPTIERDGRPTAGPRGAKAWAVLAYILLADRPVSRRRLVDLLFTDADDPRGTLRWNLSQLRRALGGTDVLVGDPIEPGLTDRDVVDVIALTQPAHGDPLQLGFRPGDLLEGLTIDGSPAFDAWLQLERHHLRSSCCTLFDETAIDRLVTGRCDEAIDAALHAVELDPLDSGHHALLVRALVAAGELGEAHAHVARCAGLYREEFGIDVPGEITHALEIDRDHNTTTIVGPVAFIDAATAAGRSALGSGAVDYGIDQLERCAAIAARERVDEGLRATVLLDLGIALLHQRGDHSSRASHRLQEAYALAGRARDHATQSRAACELAFLHIQSGHRERAVPWLDHAEALSSNPALRALMLGVRSLEASDAGRFDEALELAGRSLQDAAGADRHRQEAWSLAMIGRIHLVRDERGSAQWALERAADIVRHERWTVFSPWLDALRGEVLVRDGRLEAAECLLERAYALARHLDDHCSITMTARGLAIVRAADRDPRLALDWVVESVARPPWYLWAQAYALTTAVAVAGRLDDARMAGWAHDLAVVTASAQLRGVGAPYVAAA